MYQECKNLSRIPQKRLILIYLCAHTFDFGGFICNYFVISYLILALMVVSHSKKKNLSILPHEPCGCEDNILIPPSLYEKRAFLSMAYDVV